jgi:hypothetical protein
MNMAALLDFGNCGVESLLSTGEVGLQRLDRAQLDGQLGLQLFAVFHHLQQGILQAGLPAYQCVQLVL